MIRAIMLFILRSINMEKINKLVCRIIFIVLAFAIIAGTIIQCTGKTGKVVDVIFDHPEY
jgi:uncharacterized phage infection (PIP) family protein YhgE